MRSRDSQREWKKTKLSFMRKVGRRRGVKGGLTFEEFQGMEIDGKSWSWAMDENVIQEDLKT